MAHISYGTIVFSMAAESSFIPKHGKISTFIGRLLPGIRHLISIPAGLAKMNMRDFIIYTTIGATLWIIILAVLGYFLYAQKDLLNRFYKEISYGCILLGIAFIGYLLYNSFKKQKVEQP